MGLIVGFRVVGYVTGCVVDYAVTCTVDYLVGFIAGDGRGGRNLKR